MEHNTIDVSAAFDVLMEEIEAEIIQTETAGSQAFQQHGYAKAREALDRAGQLTTFRDKVIALRLEWDELCGLHADLLADETSVEWKKIEADPSNPVAAFRTACMVRVEQILGQTLVKKSATSYATADGAVAVIGAVSKVYTRTGQPRYWFAFHSHQAQFLESAPQSFLALGCGSPDQILLIPFATFAGWLDTLNTTERDNGIYSHIHVWKREDKFVLDRKKGFADVNLTEYLLR